MSHGVMPGLLLQHAVPPPLHHILPLLLFNHLNHLLHHVHHLPLLIHSSMCLLSASVRHSARCLCAPLLRLCRFGSLVRRQLFPLLPRTRYGLLPLGSADSFCNSLCGGRLYLARSVSTKRAVFGRIGQDLSVCVNSGLASSAITVNEE